MNSTEVQNPRHKHSKSHKRAIDTNSVAKRATKQLPTSVAGFLAHCSPPGYGPVTYTPENGCLCNDHWLLHKPYTVYYCSKWCFFKASPRPFRIGGFTAARLPGQVTCAAEPLCHSWIFRKQYTQLTKILPGQGLGLPGSGTTNAFPVCHRCLSWGPFFFSYLMWAYLSEPLIKDSHKC